MTYSALIALVTLGDDLSRVNREKFSAWLRSLQEEDGSFRAVAFGSESDSRFVYSAAASCFLLQDWSGMDVPKSINYLCACFNFNDGGFGLRPSQESHGGATYTCLASLRLLGGLNALTTEQRNSAVTFCVLKQDSAQGGFSGRSNKVCDTCYAYWIGSSLHILGKGDFINRAGLTRYLDTTSHPMIGGYAKCSGEAPDPYHTHFGICARTLCEVDASKAMEPSLGLLRDAYDRHFQGVAMDAAQQLFIA